MRLATSRLRDQDRVGVAYVEHAVTLGTPSRTLLAACAAPTLDALAVRHRHWLAAPGWDTLAG